MSLEDTIALLQGAPLIGRFERDALRLLAFSAETRRLRAGDTLFRRGDRSDGGYIVLAGEVDMVSGAGPSGMGLSGKGVSGNAEMSDATGSADATLGPGALIGRLALFVRMKRPATARARTACEVLRISPTLVRRVLAEFPEAAAGMHDEIASDLDDLSSGLDRVRTMLMR